MCLYRLSLLGRPNRAPPETGLWFPEVVLFSKEGRFDILRTGHEIKSLRLTLFAGDYAIISFQTWFAQAFYVTHFRALRRFMECFPFCLEHHLTKWRADSSLLVTKVHPSQIKTFAKTRRRLQLHAASFNKLWKVDAALSVWYQQKDSLSVNLVSKHHE